MSARVKQYRALNRLLRSAYNGAIEMRDALKSGEARKDDAARLMREVEAISADIGQGAALHRSRVQYLQNLGIGPDAAAAFQHLNALGHVGVRGMVPAIIANANAGDAKAILYASAMVPVLTAMDQAHRPMTPTKFARMISLPPYEQASVELEECQFMLDALAVMLPRLANGQLPTATDMITIGEKQRQLREGQGLRDAEALADDDAALGPQPEEEPTNDPTPDSVQHDDAEDASRPNSERQTEAPDPEPAPAGEVNASAEDRARSESTTGAQ